MKKFALSLILLLTLSFMHVSLLDIGIVKGESTIYIRADGSVEGTDKIQRDGDVYTFIFDISGSIVVERSNVLLDGAGYTLQGDENKNGITLGDTNNNTIKNLKLTSFNIGIVVMDSDNNRILENTITNNFRGLDLTASENTTVSGNYIANNTDGIALENVYNSIFGNIITNNSNFGIFLNGAGYNNIIGNNITNNGLGISVSICYNNVIYHNNFVKNTNHVETDDSDGTWDNGEEGNYWDNYTGIDSDGDGIGDTPYSINGNSQDNYPLMEMRVFDGVRFEPYVSTFHLLFEDRSHNLLGNLSGELRITEPEKEIIHSICKLSLSSPRLDEYHEPYIHKVELFTAWFFIIHPWGPVEIPQPPPPVQKVTLHVDEEIILFEHSDNVSGFEIEPRLVFWFSSGLKITPAPWGAQILPTIRVYFSDGQEWEWEYEYNVTPRFMLWSGIETNLSELSGKIETETMTFTTVEKGHPIIITRVRVIILASILVAIAVAAIFVKYRKRALEEVSHPFQIVSSA